MKTRNNFLKSSKGYAALLFILLLNPLIVKANEFLKEPLTSPLPKILFKPEFYIAFLVVLLLVISIMVLSYALNRVTKLMIPPIPKKNPIAEKKKATAFQRLVKSATVPNEEDVMLDHNYDGIIELDNSLPPWWVKMFYITIIIAVIYMFHYHIFKTGKLQTDEYNSELQIAELEKESFRKLSASNVDETTVTFLNAAEELEQGKTLFISKCSPCHGKNAEGIVGPNLTDEYWMHGGGIKNVFKSIKYGIPQKGMIAWETQMTPIDIQKVASYILSIKGSKPANAKEAQGDLYKEGNTLQDSLQVSK